MNKPSKEDRTFRYKILLINRQKNSVNGNSRYQLVVQLGTAIQGRTLEVLKTRPDAITAMEIANLKADDWVDITLDDIDNPRYIEDITKAEVPNQYKESVPDEIRDALFQSMEELTETGFDPFDNVIEVGIPEIDYNTVDALLKELHKRGYTITKL